MDADSPSGGFGWRTASGPVRQHSGINAPRTTGAPEPKERDHESYLPAAVLGTAITAAAFGLGTATADAASYTDETASQAAAALSAMGYSVQFNDDADGDLSRCDVTGVEGLTAIPSGTVYIDLSCPSSNN